MAADLRKLSVPATRPVVASIIAGAVAEATKGMQPVELRCTDCEGRGTVEHRYQPPEQVRQVTCNKCKGTGQPNMQICPVCAGRGWTGPDRQPKMCENCQGLGRVRGGQK